MDHQTQEHLRNIEVRNRKVELDKAWETSSTRKILIAIFTYIVIVLFFVVAHLPNPFVNAIVPTVGYLLSTLSLSYCKRVWIRRRAR